MTAIGRIISGGALVLLLVSCSSSGLQLKGTWQGEDPIRLQPGTDDFTAKTIRSVTLRVDANDRFSLFLQVPYEGHVAHSGSAAYLEVDTVLKSHPNEPIRFRIVAREDGSILLYRPENSTEPIRLHRVAQPNG